MLKFIVDAGKCVTCGECERDCPVTIINLDAGLPDIPADQESACIECQHCLAVCPTGAISILGVDPATSLPLGTDSFPVAQRLATLIKGRRSVRRYRDENLEPQLIDDLLAVAWHAPTGVNSRQVQFSVIDDRSAMQAFREATYAGLEALIDAGELPEERGLFAEFVRMWREDGTDVLFRGAPHLLVASAPAKVPSPLPDALIALAYFELYAQSRGVGTVWNGLAKWAIDELLPQLRKQLGIPEGHVVGNVMAFGKSAVRYHRTVQHEPPKVVRFRKE